MGISIGIKISSQRRTSLNQNSFSLSKYFAVITESGANINKSSLPFLKGEKIAIAIDTNNVMSIKYIDGFCEIEAF